MSEGLSNADVALLSRDHNDGMFGSGGGLAFWIFALLLLNNNGGFFGNRGPGGPNPVSYSDLQASQNAQTQQLQFEGLQSQLAENKFDIAEVINNQTNALNAQNNTNLINAIQGFNQVNQNLTNQTNVLSAQVTNQTNAITQQLMAMQAKMDTCCCEIKTQMLNDRLADAQAQNVTLRNALDNANQSQYILGQLGRFVAWAGSGTPSTATA